MISKSLIFQDRVPYKPFRFPWAYDLWKTQMQSHWLADDVPSWREDINDWKFNLSEQEKDLLTQIFRFFTQGDIDVAGAYINKFLPMFKHPEIRMMLLSFAAMETVHIDAYSKLIETIGMPDTEYSKFLEYDEMFKKHRYLWKDLEWTGEDAEVKRIAFDIAKFSAFTEGLQLYSSFAILKSFELVNKMKGMCQIVTYSVRDEGAHVEGMLKIYKEILSEHPSVFDEEFKKRLIELCLDMVTLEEAFIDLCFRDQKNGSTISLDWITKEEVKDFVRFTANRRMNQLGLDALYTEVKTNPLPWFDQLIAGVEQANFFEQRGSDYQKVDLQLTDDDEIEW